MRHAPPSVIRLVTCVCVLATAAGASTSVHAGSSAPAGSVAATTSADGEQLATIPPDVADQIAPTGPDVAEHSVATTNQDPRTSLSPVRFAPQVVRPGDVVRYVYFVRNYTDAAVTLRSVALPLEASRTTNSLVQLARDSDGTGEAAEWVELPFERWPDLGPGRELVSVAELTVPRGAEPGTYAMAIGVSELLTPGSAAGGANVTANAMVASQAIVTVEGDLQRSARIRSVDSPRLVWGDDDPRFSVLVENTGNALLTLDAQVEVSSFLGVASRRLPAEGKPQLVLPDGRRRLRMTWEDRPLMGWYEPRLTVVGGEGSALRLERPLGRVFVLPPWWLVVATVLAIVLPAWIGRRTRRERLERGELVGRARWTERRKARRRARRNRLRAELEAGERGRRGRRGRRRRR